MNTVKFEAMRRGDAVEFLSERQTTGGSGSGTIEDLSNSTVTINRGGLLMSLRRSSIRVDRRIPNGKQNTWYFE